MKKIITKKIPYSVGVILVLIGLGATQVLAQNVAQPIAPGQTPAPIVHQGAAAQVVNAIRLGLCSGTTALLSSCNPIADLDTRGGRNAITETVTVFENIADSFVGIIDYLGFMNRVFIGESKINPGESATEVSEPHFSGGINGINIAQQLQKVNVNGGVSATNLANTDNGRICVTPNGTLILCS